MAEIIYYPGKEKIERAWGWYQTMEEGKGWKIKELVVHPNHCLSYQKHAHRSEVWLVKKGVGTAIINGGVYALDPGKVVTVDVGKWHQLVNGGNETLVIHEIQYGSQCIEEDIERK